MIQYDTAGREVSSTDRNLNATTFAYVSSGQPGAGSLRTVTDPVGLITTLAYDATSGKLKTVTDPAGRVTTITVDFTLIPTIRNPATLTRTISPSRRFRVSSFRPTGNVVRHTGHPVSASRLVALPLPSS